jgi:hypothetical protein
MNTTKLLLGTLVGTVVYFFGGWLIWGIILKDMMGNMYTAAAMALNKPEPDLMMIALSCLVGAFLMTYIFERWAGIRTLATGAVAGAIISGLMALSYDLGFLAMTNMFNSPSSILVDVLANAVSGALGGAAIGWMLGYNRT